MEEKLLFKKGEITSSSRVVCTRKTLSQVQNEEDSEKTVPLNLSSRVTLKKFKLRFENGLRLAFLDEVILIA